MGNLEKLLSPDRPRRLLLIMVVLSLLWSLFWAIGQWPGLWDYDGLADLKKVLAGEYFSWRSLLYSAYLKIMLSVSSPKLLLTLQSCIWALWLAVIFYTLWLSSKSKWIIILFLTVLFNPLFSIYSLYARRETLQLILTPTVFVLMFLVLSRQKFIGIGSRALIFGLSLSAAILAGLRVENQYVWTLVICITAWGIRAQRKIVTLFLGSAVCFLLLIQVGFPLAIGARIPIMIPGISPGPGLHYEATGFLNPLTYILVRDYRSPNKAEDKEILSEVFDVNMLIEFQQDYEIGPFHRGAMKHNFPKESFNEVRKRYWLLVVWNLDLFLENRIKMYLRLMGLDTWYMNSYEAPDDYDGPNLEPSPISATAHSIQRNLFFLFTGNHFIWQRPIKWIFSTHILSILLAGFLAFRWKKYPLTALASSIVWARALLVFLFTPGITYYYLIEVHIWFYFAVATMILEHKRRSEEKTPDLAAP